MSTELNFLLRGLPLVSTPVTSQTAVSEAVTPLPLFDEDPPPVTGPVTAQQVVTGVETTKDRAAISFNSAPPYPCPAFEVLTRGSELERFLPILLERPLVAVDIETIGETREVGTDPRRAPIRLVSLSVADYPTLVVDCASIDVRRLAPLFDRVAAGECRLISHNAAFEQAFFRQQAFPNAGDGLWIDTMLIAQLLSAGRREGFLNNVSLDKVVERELGYTLDKAFQTGPWGSELSAEQYGYSAIDSACLIPLADRFRDQLVAAKLQRVFRIETAALPFIVWTDLVGVPFDAERWITLATQARHEAQRLWNELDALVGPIDTINGKGTNWKSAKQVLAQLRNHGYELEDTQDSTLARLGSDAVLPATLREYRKQQRRASTYADKITAAIDPVDGRIHPRLNQLGASASGRMSVSKPPIQGLPRDRRYRGCVRPSDPRNVIVKCDYSSIELRLAAQITGDQRLIEAFVNGQDVLRLTAQLLLGAGADVTPEQRQCAKAIAYGSLYGAGPATLQQSALKSYGVVLDEAEACTLQERFFALFAGLKRWQKRRNTPGVTHVRTLAGRRRLDVWSYTRKLNTPIQGSGADGMKNALGLLWQRRGQAPASVHPVLLVHDEATIECAREDADAAAAWLSAGMRDGMAEFITDLPVEVGVTIGQSWAGEPLEEVPMSPEPHRRTTI